MPKSGKQSGKHRARTGGNASETARRGPQGSTGKVASKSAAKRGDRSASLLSPDLLPLEGKLYYRIGEVSRITGVKPYVLRYWESEFRWMSPQKSRSKQRLYRRKDIEMILLIQKLLHEERFTIAGARKRLRELGIGRALEQAVESSSGGSNEPSTGEQSSGVLASPQQDVSGLSRTKTAEFCQGVRSELLAIREML